MDMSRHLRRLLAASPMAGNPAEIDKELVESQRQPRFGTSNPERMRLAFWEWIIRGDLGPGSAVEPDEADDEDEDEISIGYSPVEVRTRFELPPPEGGDPIWTFQRMGATRTLLPDGRVVCVGGEHEDYYDPDFCIYNDVIVISPAGDIEIYGYPRELFPPTDFHTATLVGDRLWIIGNVGYFGERRLGTTQVFELDLSTYRMKPVTTSGEGPGWIANHEAEVDADGIITIRGGEVLEEVAGDERIRPNYEDYSLDTRSGAWEQRTSRNWRHYSIRDEEERLFVIGTAPDFGELFEPSQDFLETQEFLPEALTDPFDSFSYVSYEEIFPRSVAYELASEPDWNEARILVGGVPVCFQVKGSTIEVVIEGDMGEEAARRLIEEVLANVEASTKRKCLLESYP